MGTTDMPEIRAPPFHNHFNDCVVVFKNVKGSSAITNGQARRNVIDRAKHIVRLAPQSDALSESELRRLLGSRNWLKDVNNKGSKGKGRQAFKANACVQ